ncbi:hypothetical protein COW64_16305 [bacterium (Candidatus Blackallbacteria) CG18_big_fil_WC_8_21_14_2_50_49_26]|nr:MAG: hypothetical protein COW64_16305 [bacterium (Candidatus Blackallbacteria) CG18_big_fil_WC_8_21_14_2_50_49_26]
MNTKFLICATLVCLTSFSACKPSEEKPTGQASEQKEEKQIQPPDVVAKEFLNTYIVDRNLKESYKYFSKADKAAKSEAQYIQEKNMYGAADIIRGMSSYEIKKSEITPEKATFTIDIKSIDMEKVIKEVMSKVTLSELASISQEELLKRTVKKLTEDKKNNIPFPMATQSESTEFILEDGKWVVFVDWAGKNKKQQSTKVTLKMGEQGTLMSSKENGDVVLKVNSVKFSAVQAGDNMVHCIVNITVTNKMKGQFTESFSTPLASAEIFANGGNKYKRDYIYAPEILKDINISDPLNPGKTVTGDIAFKIDKTAKDLILTFDSGYSPLPKNFDYVENKTLSFKLGDVSL